MEWKILQQQQRYQGHFQVTEYQLEHEKFDGSTTPVLRRELVSRNNAIALVAYDPDTDKVALVEQFRVGAMNEENPWLIEIVAGLIEAGEVPEQVAVRECQEETGCVPSNLLPLGEFYTSPGGHSEWVHLYVGKISLGEVSHTAGLQAEGEDIKIHCVAVNEIQTMLTSGEIKSAIAIIGLQRFLLQHDAIRHAWIE